MNWKRIGASAIGTSHIRLQTDCQDYNKHGTIQTESGVILYCFVADGAGSASHSAKASKLSCELAESYILTNANSDKRITEASIYSLLELIYEKLSSDAKKSKISLREYATTFIGAIIEANRGIFFQIGDGAIIIKREFNDGYEYVFWPDNGEYQNTTHFLIEDTSFSFVQMKILDEIQIEEVALLTDGLQMLCLDFNRKQVHTPFFAPMFNVLRMADNDNKISIINQKLHSYLNSDKINQNTDDDKTLVLATRL